MCFGEYLVCNFIAKYLMVTVISRFVLHLECSTSTGVAIVLVQWELSGSRASARYSFQRMETKNHSTYNSKTSPRDVRPPPPCTTITDPESRHHHPVFPLPLISGIGLGCTFVFCTVQTPSHPPVHDTQLTVKIPSFSGSLSPLNGTLPHS